MLSKLSINSKKMQFENLFLLDLFLYIIFSVASLVLPSHTQMVIWTLLTQFFNFIENRRLSDLGGICANHSLIGLSLVCGGTGAMQIKHICAWGDWNYGQLTGGINLSVPE